MKQSTIFILGGVVVLAVVMGILTKQDMPAEHDMHPAKTSQPTQETVEPNSVTISNFAFGPGSLTVKAGTTVTWTNKDDAHHNIQPTGGADDFVASELLGKNETYTFTFTKAGTYTYKCSPHPYMKGTVVVTE